MKGKEIIVTFSEPWYGDQMDVLAGLKRNKDKYGKKYCPCSLIRTDDTVCMCKEFKEMEEGTCHCQLYIKTKD